VPGTSFIFISLHAKLANRNQRKLALSTVQAVSYTTNSKNYSGFLIRLDTLICWSAWS